MKYLRFPRVLHDGEIHSIDINKDGSKLITSGKDKSVLLWDYADFENLYIGLTSGTDHSLESFDIAPIHRFEHHLSLVKIVRWSPENNNLFASADVDGHIYLVDTMTNSIDQIFPNGNNSDERELSIVDLSWSNDGRLIAWSDTKGNINLYDTLKKTCQELTKLSNLEKQVIQRSLAFDPTNNYLTSLGDDTIIYIYQYHYESSSNNYQFKLISKISKLINKNLLNVQYKRISWSADGEFVSVPTASKNTTSLVSLISRSKNWQSKISLVGHNYNCEVVRFNPKIFQEDSDGHQIFHVIATAGSDKTVVIWNTSKDSPILILQDVAAKPIVDLSWSRNGKILFSVALDGYLSIYFFEGGDLGEVISEKLLAELTDFKNVYVKPFNVKNEKDQQNNSGKKVASSSLEILDQKDILDLPTENASSNNRDKDNENSEKKMDSTHDGVNQKITKGDVEPGIIPFSIGEPVMTEKDVLLSAMSSRQAKASPKKPKQEPKALTLERPKITKDKKKRVQPTLISNNNPNRSEFNDLSSNTKSKVISSSKTSMEFDKPSYSVSEDISKQSKRSKSGDELQSNKKMKRELEPVKFIGSVILNPNTTFARVRLSIPKVRLNFQLSNTESADPFILDIRNGTGNETTPSRVSCSKNEKLIWSDFVPKFIQLATVGSNFWATCTADGQIIIYSQISGRRLLPPFILGSPLSFLESNKQYLLAVTCVGELFVWNIDEKRIELNCSFSPLLELSIKSQSDGLSKSDNITMCSITSNGIPLVTLSNGSGYLFNKELCTWQTITESWWAFGSHYWDSNEDSSTKPQFDGNSNSDSSIIGLLEQKTNDEILRKSRTGRGKYFNKISKNMIMKEGFENLENTISLSHLENRILCCEILEENSDFKRFFITYVQRICELGLKAKLYEVCDQLLGPVGNNEDVQNTNKSSKICGHDKHELLREVILSCASNRNSQRVLIHFGRKVGLIDVGDLNSL
ncbi:uncharacterized protein PRCAT00000975001 [Priceomyces carsonii]|uniref:uncharacterized protein n=1 Tax=Priceomyces carsonii TaxID=28549 RepID=UPI002EDA1F27|nr:unnamed protein product [Priceomyces carsonii]